MNVGGEAAQAAAPGQGAGGDSQAKPNGEAPDLEALQAQLSALQTQAHEYLEGWQRARAEFANYKRRIERELQENHEMALGMAFKHLLPIVDDFDRALASVPAELVENPWVSGVSMVQRKLIKMLEDNGVVAFDPVGELFDPNRHEAVGTEDAGDDIPSGQITATLQRGYALGERVLRPALVRVAR
jgi:molecular chaperone GrpE